MKRIVSLISALALVLALSVPAMAETPTGGQSVISYTVSPSYEITIPTDGVTISGASANANVAVNAGSLIDAGKHLEFSISDAANYDDALEDNVGFRLKSATDSSVYLHYAISCTSIPDIVKDTVFLSATASEVNAGKQVTLTFAPDTATQAGIYNDTITFTVAAVENVG